MSKNKKAMVFLGTRPEAIKLAPLIKQLQESSIEVVVCSTGQHREMLQQVIDFFDIPIHHNMDVMTPNQTLNDLSSKVLKNAGDLIKNENPDVVIVQGDTTTAMSAGLAGFNQKIKVAHIEAGLRSGNKWSPFPEEINRKILSQVCDFHFAPTKKAVSFLNAEGFSESIYNVGNTGIDALFLCKKLLAEKNLDFSSEFSNLSPSKPLILVSAHRRESFGQGIKNICAALKELSRENVELLYPVHLNPNIRDVVFAELKDTPGIHLCDPVSYERLVWLMQKSQFILTDSGGIQEEAPSLGKPVLVLRENTERPEGIEAGNARLVGTDVQKIITEAKTLLSDESEYEKMSKAGNPYGDGTTSKQVIDVLQSAL